LIDWGINILLVIWNYIATDIGAQWVFLALCAEHVALALDRSFERWLIHRGAPVQAPLAVLVAANWVYSAVFFLTVLITGANPRLARAAVMPYTRGLWFVLAILLAVCVVVKTRRLFAVWLESRQDGRQD